MMDVNNFITPLKFAFCSAQKNEMKNTADIGME